MILTTSLLVSMILLGTGMLLWGIWIATFRAATTGQKWRFEFYCFDFSIGILVAGLVGALTLGTLGWDGFGFLDELGLAGKRQELWAFLAGVTFNLGNMLMLGAASVSGVLLSVPVATGLAFALGAIFMNLVNPGGSWLMLSAGAIAVVVGLVLGHLADRGLALARLEAAIQAGKTKSTRKTVSSKGLILTICAALFLSAFFPFLELARVPDLGVGPYTAGFLVAFGIFASTITFNLFFMNLPVLGKPAEIGDFFRGSAGNHLLGFLGGVLWMAGTVAHYVAVRSEGAALPQPVYQYAAFGLSSLVVGILGLAVWNEMGAAEGKVRLFGFGMLFFVLIGAALTSVSQLATK